MRIGIIGGGQLGQMLALSGIELGMQFVFLDPGESPPAATLGEHIRAAFDDEQALQALAERCDKITFEFENIPAAILRSATLQSLQPNPQVLMIAQERALEKQAFEDVGIPVAPWRAVDSQEQLEQTVADLGLPLIAKIRSLGYDGKGQRRITHTDHIDGLYESMGGVSLLVERLVNFDREVSVIGTRAANGDMVIYPLTENVHREGILHSSIAPISDRQLCRQANNHFRTLSEKFNYVGTMAIEFFVADNVLLGNEFAPRVHNTGHWTIEGATTSQFENHLRAIAGLPLGNCSATQPCAMVNLISRMPAIAPLLAIEGAHLHDYGKQPRAGRKLGHITVCAKDETRLNEKLKLIESLL